MSKTIIKKSLLTTSVKSILSGLIVSTLFVSSNLQADQSQLKITEVYGGISDAGDGTFDWIEITNLGEETTDTRNLFFTDNGNLQVPMPEVWIAPNESVVFLIGDSDRRPGDQNSDPSREPGDLFDSLEEEFVSIWPQTPIRLAVIPTTNSDGIGHDVDFVRIFSAEETIDQVNITEEFENSLTTIDVDAEGTRSLSQLGVNGAYSSNPFLNMNFAENGPLAVEGFEDGMVTLIGSPGTHELSNELPYQFLNNRLNNHHLRKKHNSHIVIAEPLDQSSWGFQWRLVDAGNGYVFLQNKLNGDDEYLRQRFESNEVVALPLDPQSWGFYWMIEETDDGYIHLKNRLSGEYLRNDFISNAIQATALENFEDDSWGFDWMIDSLPDA